MIFRIKERIKSTLLIGFMLSLLSACTDIPSTNDIATDMASVENEINDARKTVSEYSGGLLFILASTRLETLLVTRAMLEQKKSGLKRFISTSYSVDGRKHVPPSNKQQLIREIEQDITKLKKQLEEAEMESQNYSGGLIGVLSSTSIVTIKISIAFLEQRMLVLKHDIPYYSLIDELDGKDKNFIPTPGEDIDKF